MPSSRWTTASGHWVHAGHSVSTPVEPLFSDSLVIYFTFRSGDWPDCPGSRQQYLWLFARGAAGRSVSCRCNCCVWRQRRIERERGRQPKAESSPGVYRLRRWRYRVERHNHHAESLAVSCRLYSAGVPTQDAIALHRSWLGLEARGQHSPAWQKLGCDAALNSPFHPSTLPPFVPGPSEAAGQWEARVEQHAAEQRHQTTRGAADPL